MTNDELWDDLVRAERELRSARTRFLAEDPTEVLRRKLALTGDTPPDQDLALHLLHTHGGTRPDVVEALAPELFEWSLGANSYRSQWMREVLCLLDRQVLERLLRPLVAGFIADRSRDAADYSGLLALLDMADLPGLARTVTAAMPRTHP
ncbi:hypothetical protein WEI85_45845 [Actinomycetes bacterium KLBMP 9797]